MKISKDYTSIEVCPVTEEQILSEESDRSSKGVCPRCGHLKEGSSYCHVKIVPGRWKTPSLWERMQGKKAEFLRKDKEDAIMGALKGEFES